VNLFERMAALRDAGRHFAVATVVRTLGSTPQVVGAKLVVVDEEPRGKAAGTLGGGCVEADAIDTGRDVLGRGGRSLRAYELTEDLAWNTGLVCGGTMWILVERDDDALSVGGEAVLDRLVTASAGDAPLAIATLLRKSGREVEFLGRMLVASDGVATGSLGDPSLDRQVTAAAVGQLRHASPRLWNLDEERDVLIEPVSSKPHVVVAGGGHVALAIARQAQLLDFDVTIV